MLARTACDPQRVARENNVGLWGVGRLLIGVLKFLRIVPCELLVTVGGERFLALLADRDTALDIVRLISSAR